MRRQKYKVVWLLAKRDLLSDRKITVIVVAMLGFSFLNLTFFPAFIDGLSNTFTSDLIETQTGHVAIQPEDGPYLQDADSLVQKAQRLDGVVTVEKRLEFSADVSFQDETATVQMVGTSALGQAVYTSRIRQGVFLRRGDTTGIVLGQEIADEGEEFGVDGLGVERGRIVSVSSAAASGTFTVRGSIGRPGASSLTRQAFIAYDAAEQFTGTSGAATAVHIILAEREDAAAVKQRLQQLNTRGKIETWRERSNIAESFQGTFSIVTAVISLVGVIIAVTSIGVVIFINTNKRRREMGIVRSIGAKDRTVIFVFLLEALLFGTVGVLVGNALMLGIDAYLQVRYRRRSGRCGQA